MKLQIKQQVLSICFSALVGGGIGYLCAGASTNIAKLESENAQLKASLESLRVGHAGSVESLNRRDVIAVNQTTNISAKGEYKRLSDAERQANYHQRVLNNWVANAAAERNAEYNSVFTTLGLSSDKAEHFKSNVVQLHRKAIAAGDPLLELMKARRAYDKEIRAALGEENYKLYRNFEESKPAAREYKLIEDFASKEKRITLDPAFTDHVIQLINVAGATTTETWHEPYDPIPRPKVGIEAMRESLAEQVDGLKRSSSSLQEELGRSLMPDDQKQIITDYYAKLLDSKQKELEFARLPAEERKKRMDEMHNAESKAGR